MVAACWQPTGDRQNGLSAICSPAGDRRRGDSGGRVSREIVAALVTGIATSPGLCSRANLGVNKPGTDGARPGFI